MSKSWIFLQSITGKKFQDLTRKAELIKNFDSSQKNLRRLSLALVFFEPSTRTRLSFERACHVLGASYFSITSPQFTSIEKGESLEDTLVNIAAMEPDALIVRCADHLNLLDLSQQISRPIICAGWGTKAHPTQALLDAYTLHQYWGSLEGKNILYVGDAMNSRVLASHLELFPKLQVNLGFYVPHELQRREPSPQSQTFTFKRDALNWADVVIGLRLQKERLEKELRWDKFASEYQVCLEDLEGLKKKLPIMHPGPVGWDHEFRSDLKHYEHSLILKQVTHGVYMRAALISELGA